MEPSQEIHIDLCQIDSHHHVIEIPRRNDVLCEMRNILVIIIVVLAITSCSKDKNLQDKQVNQTQEGGGIVYKQFNQTIEWEQANQFNHVDIDIDGDSTNETAFYLVSEYGTILDISYDNILVQTYCPESSSKIYFSNYEGGNDPYIYVLTKSNAPGTLINDELGENFERDITYLSVKINDHNGALQYTEGDFYGAGDTYIGFKIKIDDEYHFGWLRVNLSADLKTLQIIDGAYQSEPDVPINAGTH